MTTAITNSPLNDSISSYAAIERLPRLIAEEEAQLLADLRLASRAPAAKARLIEGYLPRVLTLARQYDRRYRVITFDDLVQEGSLALIKAIDKCATMPITKSLSRYIGTVVRSAFARAIGTDAPIHMPNSTWHYIHNSGRAQEYAWMQTMRLDVTPVDREETWTQWLRAPALVLPAPQLEEGQRDERCHQLMGLLDRLTARQRQILRLRYGLDPTDARSHSREETGRLLGISPGSVYTMEQYALATLRHLYETLAATGCLSSSDPSATATPSTVAHSRKPLTDAQQQYHQRRHAEQQAKLEAAFHTMQEQGLPITGQTLKQAAQVNYRAACAFAQQHIPQSADRAHLRALSLQQRLEEAFAGMVARGESLSITALKAAAHTDAPAARAFLRSRGILRLWGGPPRKANRATSDKPAHEAARGIQ